MSEQTVTQVCVDTFDSSLIKSNMVLVVGSGEELASFYEHVIPHTLGTQQGTVVAFTLCEATERLAVDETKMEFGEYDGEDVNREEAESKYIEDVVEQMEKIRSSASEDSYKSYTVVFFSDYWNMLERKLLLKSSRKFEDGKDYGCHSPIIERLAKLCRMMIKNKNVKVFIFRDEYNTARYYKNTTSLTDLELSCTERVFLSFGNTLNISVLSQELADYLPDVKPLDICYNLSGGKIGYIQRVVALVDDTMVSLEKYVIEFLPQHYIEAQLSDKIDLSVSVIIDDGVTTQKEPILLYSSVEKITSIINESEDPYDELRALVADSQDHKQLLEVTAIKDPVKRQQKIAKYRSTETVEYMDKFINAVTETLIKLLAPPLLGSKRPIAIIEDTAE